MLRPALLLPLLALAACGEKVKPSNERVAPDLMRPQADAAGTAVPVRIGEGGPAFRACQAAGAPREPGAPLPVRAGPFDAAPVTGALPPDARAFVCTRSIDQRWLGVVYDPSGALSPACGVSVPVPRRANYAGPCRSGWVASAAVRLVAD